MYLSEPYPIRQLPDGRWLAVFPLTFGRARLVTMKTADSRIYDDSW